MFGHHDVRIDRDVILETNIVVADFLAWQRLYETVAISIADMFQTYPPREMAGRLHR